MMKFIFMNLFSLFMVLSLINYFNIQLMFMFSLMFMLFSMVVFGVDFFSMVYLFMGVDVVSYILLLLLMWMGFMILLASLSSLNLGYFNRKFMLVFLILMVSLVMVFLVLNLFLFYLMFEFSLIPMFFMVLGWGFQYDRVEAGFYMFIYTFIYSLPLLMCLCLIDYQNLSMVYLLSNMGMLMDSYIYLFLNLAFLVKLPIYSFHMWLPKAHVEASVGGSMILASVMLKLGSYGILRFMLMFLNSYNLYSFSLVLWSILGSVMASLVCLRQMDLKILVAYSSVVHMGVLLGGLILLKNMSILGGVIIMISHGLCSSGMFVLVNLVYERLSSRNIFMNKGLVSVFPYLTVLWFIISVNNMSSPPSLNLFGEYLLLLVIGGGYLGFMWIMGLVMFLSACYSIFFYSYSQYGEINLNLFCMVNVSVRENLVLLMHLIPLNLLFLNLFLFI
uniref:NADH-ubiquinone oxidoreductase chain 4 n=1 Tax=Dendrocerus sp. ZJUH_2016009 TaxID=2491154 RepID=A0A3S8V0J0_9HYME|nr:NADH dehydrogenase subunit 4 [Dendrocerus sp. ZJUH_2016009]